MVATPPPGRDEPQGTEHASMVARCVSRVATESEISSSLLARIRTSNAGNHGDGIGPRPVMEGI